MEPAPHGHQDVLNNSTEVHPSNRTDQTDRAVNRIDPRSSEWSFGWNHDQTTGLTVPELVFQDHPDILRTIVEPDLAWVVKNMKTDMDSHPADHPDSPA